MVGILGNLFVMVYFRGELFVLGSVYPKDPGSTSLCEGLPIYQISLTTYDWDAKGYQGNLKPSFLGVMTHILRAENLNFFMVLGSKGRYTQHPSSLKCT